MSGLFRKICRWSSGVVAMAVNVFTALILLASAWGGLMDPVRFPLVGVLCLGLPIVLPVALALFMADAIWWRPSALVMGMALALAMPVAVDVFPLGTGAFVDIPGPGPGEKTLTLLTYNCANFYDMERYDESVGNRLRNNPTVEFILDSDADIVALQESEPLSEMAGTRMTHAAVDSLHLRYPYIVEDEQRGISLLSKYPVEPILLGMRYEGRSDDKICAYVIDLGERRLTLFSVHLFSFGLTPDDKALYEDVTNLDDKGEGRRAMLSRVKNSLVSKLSYAASARSRQASSLAEDIRRFATSDVIVCGDFNDVPGCYSLRTLSREGFREVYPAVGRGYMPTFNSDRFYFEIDHVLWRGSIQPISLTRPRIFSSDHYPLIVKFKLLPVNDHQK